MTEITKPTQREETELALIEYGFQFQQAEFLARVATNPLFQAIQREQDRQLAKWGQQDHPSFLEMDDDEREDRRKFSEAVKEDTDDAAKDGTLTWEHILVEELFEAKAETENDENLKTELIQVAAVALSWIESIERKRRMENAVETSES